MVRRTAFRLASACAAALATGLVLATVALAVNPVIADCTAHNQLTRHYSLTQLQGALNALPVDVKEYTACYDVIQRQLDQQLGGARGNGAGNGGGGSFLPVPVIVLLALLIVGGLGFAGWSVYRSRAEAAGEPGRAVADETKPPVDPPTQSL